MRMFRYEARINFRCVNGAAGGMHFPKRFDNHRARGGRSVSGLSGRDVSIVSVPVGLMAVQIQLLHSNEFDPAISRLPLHSMRLCRLSLNFAHVPVVYACYLPIVPGDRDRIPTCFGDNAAVSGIASPINAGALLEALRFVDCHWLLGTFLHVGC